MYNVHYIGQFNLPAPGFTCQVSGAQFATESECIAHQTAIFEEQDSIPVGELQVIDGESVWVVQGHRWEPRPQLSLQDRIKLYQSSRQ